jgi:hypothetical protein
MKNRIPTTYFRICLPVPIMVALRKMAHDHKRTMATVVRQMIYHHLGGEDYSIYVGRPAGHKWSPGRRKHQKIKP